ncbi:PREDICTED: semaphorin-7A [Thamnophis sirtalis]|uniref:Semaphorin-7A n=1 Tax=Thamnophis sirtalis TaxID=35019 RepID=A0A6I9YLN3_9SAUR|nr:PREDICTED: semaphorin-7A [Thamnophis sirtalis]
MKRFDVNTSECEDQKDAVNYLTFIGKYQGKVLICGTNACKPTCWNWVRPVVASSSLLGMLAGGDLGISSLVLFFCPLQVGLKKSNISAQSLAPFGLDNNSLVLIDGKDIYSTIRKFQYNGRIPRFRRVLGAAELYTSDTVMKNPQFVKIAPIKQEEAYNDKIYFFFREDNPDFGSNNPLAPKKISRVAQVCKGDKGGNGSFSAAKWTTLLKSMLVCVDSDTNKVRNFDQLQDVFIVESEQWSETKIYGLFQNEWGYSAVCVYSVDDISKRFRTSPLKNYSGKTPAVKPGQVKSRALSKRFIITVLQSLNHDVPQNICPTSNNSEGNSRSPYAKEVSVALHSRYFMNCSQESHYANYTWFHNDRPVAHCNSGHRHCLHFIDNMTAELYGKYSCVSTEDWFNQTVITEYLENPAQGSRERQEKSIGFASTPSLSFWLGLLHMIAIVFIVQ